MDGPDNFNMALDLLAKAADPGPDDNPMEDLAAAQVHATLALACATDQRIYQPR